MSFVDGFLKIAAAEPINFTEVGKSLWKGLKSSGGSKVKEAINPLTIHKHLSEAAKKAGGWGKAFTSQAGRQHLAEGVGKAAPSLGMAGAYAYGAKKIYDKATAGQTSDNYY